MSAAIQYVMGPDVTLVSSAEETANDVYRRLVEHGLERTSPEPPTYAFEATGDDKNGFIRLARRFLGPEVSSVGHTSRPGRSCCPTPKGPHEHPHRRPQRHRPPSRHHRAGVEHAGRGQRAVSFGNTKVLCTASFTNGVPRWMQGKGTGWVTAEYSMLPRSTNERMQRESIQGKVGSDARDLAPDRPVAPRGRRHEGPRREHARHRLRRLQADGGTRTASITGAYVAMVDAIEWGREQASSARRPHR